MHLSLLSLHKYTLWILVLLSGIVVQQTEAANYTLTTSGEWNVGANWEGTAPTSSDNAFITNSLTANASTGVSANAATVYIGNNGSGTVNIAGGTLGTTVGYVGYSANSTGSVSVSNSGVWTNSGSLYLANGDYSTSILSITGGNVSNTNGFLGYATNSTGTATVTTNGNWVNSQSLQIGSLGNGTLNITGGNVSNNIGYIGYSAGSSGVATINSGSWSNSGILYIGRSSNGTLNIAGGNVSNTSAHIGRNSGSVGSVTISNGTWSNNGDIFVGNGGTGALTITGGTVSVGASGTGSVTIANGSGINGTLNIGTGGSVGTLAAGLVNGGNGTAVVNFNHTSTSSFAPTLMGNLSVNKLGNGTTILTGTNTYNGTTRISRGVLLVNGNQSGTIGTVTVDLEATLGGEGTVGGAITVNDGGILLAGGGAAASGILTVSNSLTMGNGDGNNSILAFGLGAGGAHSTLARTGAEAWIFDTNQKFTFLNSGLVTTGTYSGLITGLSGVTTNNGTWTITNSSWSGSFIRNGDAIDLNLTSVPEPCTSALLSLAGGVFFLMLRLKHKKNIISESV